MLDYKQVPQNRSSVQKKKDRQSQGFKNNRENNDLSLLLMFYNPTKNKIFIMNFNLFVKKWQFDWNKEMYSVKKNPHFNNKKSLY